MFIVNVLNQWPGTLTRTEGLGLGFWDWLGLELGLGLGPVLVFTVTSFILIKTNKPIRVVSCGAPLVMAGPYSYGGPLAMAGL